MTIQRPNCMKTLRQGSVSILALPGCSISIDNFNLLRIARSRTMFALGARAVLADSRGQRHFIYEAGAVGRERADVEITSSERGLFKPRMAERLTASILWSA